VGAAFVQAYGNVIPPVANGICLICHPRDLLNWLANATAGFDWPVTTASIVHPFLTVVGVLVGACFAAWRNGELKARPARGRLRYFVLGFLSLQFGLLLAACPIRIVLLSAYGSPLGFAGWAAVGVAVVATTLVVRYRARRSVGGGDS